MFRSTLNSRANLFRSLVLGLISLALLGSPATADVSRAVFPGGGGLAGSEHYNAMATIGEPIAGVSGGGNFNAVVGFLGCLKGGSPPTGELSPDPLGYAGFPQVVSADLEDDQGIASAALYYRMGGTTTYTQVQMSEAPSEPGRWEGTIPAEVMTERGVQYYVVASDGTLTTTLPAGAPMDAVANLTVEVTDLAVFELPESRYVLLGMPFHPAGEADAEDLFDELGAYDKSNWRYGTYDGYRYNEFPDGDSPEPGKGFWLISKNAKTIRSSGTSTALDGDFEIGLRAGWNQIANPFAFAVSFSDLTIPDDTEHNLIAWDSDDGSYDYLQTTLEPGKGYWIKHGGEAGESLMVPPKGAGTSSMVAPNLVTLAGPGSGWSIRADVRAGDFGDADNRFGMRPDATSEKDAFDFSHPPPPASGYTSFSFTSEDAQQRLLVDYRNLNSEGERWRMRLASDQKGASYEIRFTLEGELPGGWSLLAIEDGTLRETDLHVGGVLRGQVMSSDFERVWHAVAGPPDYLGEIRADIEASHLTHFALQAVGPNPFHSRDGISLALLLPQASPVTLRVIGPGGQVVKTLQEGRLRAGIHRVLWDGTNNRGRDVASGVYFVEMRGDHFTHVRNVVLVR